MGVVKLDGAQERHDARGIDVVGDFLLHDADVVPLNLVEEGHAPLDRVGFFPGPHDFVIAGGVEGLGRRSRHQRTEDRRPLVPLVVPELIFFSLLEIGTDRDGHSDHVPVRSRGESHAAGAGERSRGQHESERRDNHPVRHDIPRWIIAGVAPAAVGLPCPLKKRAARYPKGIRAGNARRFQTYLSCKAVTNLRIFPVAGEKREEPRC